MKPAHKQRGMTLVEMVISIVLISIAMTAVLTAFSTSMGRSSDPLWKNKSLKLAQLYLDEILSKKYDVSTPLGGVPATPVGAVSCNVSGPKAGSRASYNNVDDYNGINEKPQFVTGAALGAYDGYNVKVSVVCAGDDVGLATNNAKRITVTVTPPGQSPMPFSVYRSNF
ncbi:type II secretion system protein [Alkalimarinus coralli]|uniref:type II secretion system protein n=1 Tax=Alkalimarinus coralli TaxID=2935863 RepID=UPI00202B3818|nr:type II secretion system protein [Alkalimarinus coralli]